MERKGHWLKPGVRATAPNVLFSLVASPTHTPTGRGELSDWLDWGGADVCVSRWRRGRWGPVVGARCETPDALHQWMNDHAEPRARNYVVTPDGMSTVAICRLFDHLSTAPVKWLLPGTILGAKSRAALPRATTFVRRCSFSPRVLIFDYQRGPFRWVWLAGRQHFDLGEDELARAVGEVWRDTGEYDPEDAKVVHTSEARSILWNRAYQHLADWWRATAKAPFGLTAASMSIGVLRTHVKPKSLCTHTLTEAHQLERDGCFGGMARVFYYGDIGHPRAHSRRGCPAPPRSCYGSIPGPLTQLDVRSCFPWLLRERRFPCKLFTFRERMRAQELLDWCRSFGAIARVTVETETPEYPLRTKNGIIYPVGRFTTTLCGPELLRIAQEGRIAAVHCVSLYDMGTPFTDAAGALIAMREGARKSENHGWEWFAKIVANALGGKLAQRRGEWVERPDWPAKIPFGEWSEAQRGKQGRLRFRSLAGLVWEHKTDPTGFGPYTAAFAYLHCYARLHLRGIRDAFPARSVVQVDTDGLWVLSARATAVRFKTDARRAAAGDLCLRGSAAAGRFFGAKHYYVPGGWVLAGFAQPTVQAQGRKVRDTFRSTPIAGPLGGPPRGTCVEQRASALVLETGGDAVGPDGWAKAPRKRGTA